MINEGKVYGFTGTWDGKFYYDNQNVFQHYCDNTQCGTVCSICGGNKIAGTRCDSPDLAVINALIENNGLEAEKDAPYSWNFASWSNSAPSRIVYLTLDGKNLKGDVSFAGLSELTQLSCNSNQIVSLDVSGLTNLTTLSCSGNQLTALDVSGLSSLTNLSCQNNQLTSLVLSDLPKLTHLNCSENKLASLLLPELPALGTLSCNDNDLTSIDASVLPALWQLHCDNNNMVGEFKVTGYSKSLQYDPQKVTQHITGKDCDNTECGTTCSICGGNLIKGICDYSATDLAVINALIENNGLSAKKNDPSDWSMWAKWNDETPKRITELDVSLGLKRGDASFAGLSELQRLHCGKNFGLTSIDASGLTKLTHLYCNFNNQLTSLNVSGSINLAYLNCSDGQIASLDVSGLPVLEVLDCRNNNMIGEFMVTGLDKTVTTDFRYSFQKVPQHIEGKDCDNTECGTTCSICGKNLIKGVCDYHPDDVAVINALIDNNGLAATKDAPHNDWSFATWNDETPKRMTALNLNTKQLKGDVSLAGLSELTQLSCNSNQIVSLDVSGLTNLTTLSCSGNLLTSLDVSGLPVLEVLDCRNNNMIGEFMVTGLDKTVTTTFNYNSQKGTQYAETDVAVINALIENNGLAATKDNPASWTFVTWSTAAPKQITRLNLRARNLTGDVSFTGLSELEQLDCYKNQLTSIDISGLKKLTDLVCSGQTPTLTLTAAGDVFNCEIALNNPTPAKFASGIAYTDGRLTSTDHNIKTSAFEVEVTGKPDSKLTGTFTLEYSGLLTGSIEISEANFPDEKFRNWLTNPAINDYGKDGVLTAAEIAKITSINISERGIADLTGINYLTALTSLTCSDNQIASLDVSGLTNLATLSCGNNLLASLTVSGLANLKDLRCSNNHLTALDVSGTKIAGSLYCGGQTCTLLLAADGDVYSGEIALNNHPTPAKFTTGIAYTDGKLTSIGSDIKTSPFEVEVTGSSNSPKLTGTLTLQYSGKLTGIEINETNFPDKNFREWILAQTYGQDGVLTPAKIASVKTMDVSNRNIADLTGLNYFTALTDLRCSDNQLATLDVSELINLTSLRCYHNQLASLDVSELASLETLNCHTNQLTTLDVSGLTNLRTVDCYAQTYTLLLTADGDVYSHEIALNNPNPERFAEGITYTGGKLTSTSIDIKGSEFEVEVIGKASTKLNGILRLQYSGPSIDIEINEINFPDKNFRDWLTNPANIKGYGSDGKFIPAEIEGITTMEVNGNEIADLTGINYFTKLTFLNCSGNKLASLEVPGLANLRLLYCNNNELASLDVSGLTNLTSLRCNNNELASLKMSNLTSLATLDCDTNQLAALDVSELINLTSLRCNNNQLASLDVSELASLETLNCSNNQLASLSGVLSTKLTFLYCNNNQLTSLNVSGLATLKSLTCRNNQLASLAVSGLTNLETLDCSDNRFTALNVSGLTKLDNLYCTNNQLTALDLSGVALWWLECYNQKPVLTLAADGDVYSGTIALNNPDPDSFAAGIAYTGGKLTSTNRNVITSKFEVEIKGWNPNPTLSWGDEKLTGTFTLQYKGTLTGVEINETNFPDENFREWLTNPENINGYGKDEFLDPAEITAITSINISEEGIADLTGINYLTELISLNCSGNQLTVLDLTANAALTDFTGDAQKTTVTKPECGGVANEPFSTEVKEGMFLSGTITYNYTGTHDFSELGTLISEATCTDPALHKAKCSVCGAESETEILPNGEALNCNGIEINETNFPDENFREWLTNPENINGYGEDGLLTPDEIAEITTIDVKSVKNITDLTGINYFIELTYLNCAFNQLTALNVSGLKKLTELNCPYNQLRTLNVSGLKNLTELDCTSNKLTTLDVSGLTNLTTLFCSSNQLGTLNVSGLKNLNNLNCNSNQLTSLDVSGLTKLQGISWDSQKPTLTLTADVDVYSCEIALNNPDLTKFVPGIAYADGKLTSTSRDIATSEFSVEVSGWSGTHSTHKLTGTFTLQYSGTLEGIEINEINFPDENFREWLTNSENINGYGVDGILTPAEIADIKEIDVSQKNIADLTGINYFVVLTKLNCLRNQLTALDVSELTNLTWLCCNNNQLSALDVSGLENLMELYCLSSKLSSLDVSGLTNLTLLNCRDNMLTTLDVSGLTNLKSLDCDGNQFSSLDVSGLTNLTYLSCSNNNFTSLDVSGLSNLTELSCNNNNLISLDVSGLTNLTYLNCSNNQFSSLNVSEVTNLTYLNCSNNLLTTLDVSGLANLTQLNCRDNQLITLDVSGLTDLQALFCSGNQLTALDLTNNTYLLGFDGAAQKTTITVAQCTGIPSEEFVAETGKAGMQLSGTIYYEYDGVTHHFENYISNNDATCTTDGTETATCSHEGCNEKHTRIVANSALGHDYIAVVTAPTCTENGFTTYTCSRGDDEYTDDEEPALGHDFTKWIVNPENDREEIEVCARCGEKSGKTREVTCTHEWADFVETLAPTCTTDGVKTKICTLCHVHGETKPIPALGHDYVAVVTAPTCTENGFTTYTCSRGDYGYIGDEVVATIPTRPPAKSICQSDPTSDCTTNRAYYCTPATATK